MRIDTSELDKLGDDLGRGAVRLGAVAAAALRKTAFDMESSAKAAAPVDTGALRSSISTTFEGDGRYGRMAAEIGPTVDYGIYLEVGTSRMAPQPYLGPAYDRHIDGLTEALAQLDRAVLGG